MLSYTRPAFDTNLNHQTKLTTASPYLIRSSGQYHEYGFSLDVACFLALTDKATYGNVTYMRWDKTSSGCSLSRILWGSGTDVQQTDIVRASCR